MTCLTCSAIGRLTSAVDWEISHDYSDGPLGHIFSGDCDPEVRTQIEAFGWLAEEMLEGGLEFPEL